MFKWALPFLFLSVPALSYQGGTLKSHNHTSAAGDGGQLSNIVVASSLTVTGPIAATTPTFTGSGAFVNIATYSVVLSSGLQINGGSSIFLPVGGAICFNGGTSCQLSAGTNVAVFASSTSIGFADANRSATNTTPATGVAMSTLTITASGNYKLCVELQISGYQATSGLGLMALQINGAYPDPNFSTTKSVWFLQSLVTTMEVDSMYVWTSTGAPAAGPVSATIIPWTTANTYNLNTNYGNTRPTWRFHECP